MNERETIIRIIDGNFRGDDLTRARLAFGRYTQQQMQEQYGESGMTPAQIIAGYEEHNGLCDRLIAWVKSARVET